MVVEMWVGRVDGVSWRILGVVAVRRTVVRIRRNIGVVFGDIYS